MEATTVPRSSLLAVLFVLVPLLLCGCHGSEEGPAVPARTTAQRRFYDMLTHGTIAHPDLRFTLHAREVRGWKLTDVVFKRKDARGEVEWVACARDGEVDVHAGDRKLVVHLWQGSTLAADGARARFDHRVVEMPLPEHFCE
jgi:hypothetical protein